MGYDVAACDNGVLLSGGFQTADIGTPPPLHFSCYEVPRGGIAPQSVTLVDRFGSTTAKAPGSWWLPWSEAQLRIDESPCSHEPGASVAGDGPAVTQ